MNNDLPEMFEKMEKRKLRKYRLYMANLVYQWVNIVVMMFYLVSPFVLKVKVGPITYFSNLIFIPLFSAMLFDATKDAIKTKTAPVLSGAGFMHGCFGFLKELLPSMFTLAMWLTVAVFQKEAMGNYSWLIWGSIVPWLFFAIICCYYSSEHIDDYYDLPFGYEIDYTKSEQALKKLLQIIEYEPSKTEQQIKRSKKLKEYSFRVYIHNLLCQWISLVGMLMYIVAPIIFKLEANEVLQHLNLVLIPVFTIVLYNRTRFVITNKEFPNLKGNNNLKCVGKSLGLILPSIVAMCEWGRWVIFMHSYLRIPVTIIVATILSVDLFIILTCYFAHKTIKENENE